jgi:hypothetical protein
VDPPSAGPFDDPVQQICINKEWLPYIAGACKQLLLEATWKDTTGDDLVAVQGKVFDLISAFLDVSDGCGVLAPNLGCFSGSFNEGAYGSESDPDLPCTCERNEVDGWVGCDDDSLTKTKLSIKQSFNSTFVREYEIFGAAPAANPSTINYTAYLNGDVVATASHFHTAGSFVDDLWSLGAQADTIVVEIEPDDNTQFLSYSFGGFRLCYAGDFPFSNEPGLTFSHTFDFTSDDGGWTALSFSGNTCAVYSSGVGWIQSLIGPLDGPNSFYEILAIYKDFSSREVVRIDVEFAYSAGTFSGNTTDSTYSIQHASFGGPFLVNILMPNVPSSPQTWTGDEFLSEIDLNLKCGWAVSGDPGGTITVTKITVHGIGSDPF